MLENHKLTSGTDCTGPSPDGPATGSVDDARAECAAFGLAVPAEMAVHVADPVAKQAPELRDDGRDRSLCGVIRPGIEAPERLSPVGEARPSEAAVAAEAAAVVDSKAVASGWGADDGERC